MKFEDYKELRQDGIYPGCSTNEHNTCELDRRRTATVADKETLMLSFLRNVPTRAEARVREPVRIKQ